MKCYENEDKSERKVHKLGPKKKIKNLNEMYKE